MAARRDFTAQFSRKSFADVETLPLVDVATNGNETVGAVLTRTLHFTSSVSAARRIARQNGLRLVLERGDQQDTVVLNEEAVTRPLYEALVEALKSTIDDAPVAASMYLKAGRKVARIKQT